jgi:threonine dehydrogenase-like Zn-dependent dehydrogenase
LPITMRASVLTAPGQLAHQHLELAPVGAEELLVRVLSSGICGSDLAVYRGAHPYKEPPVVLGHELCGVVESVGARVSRFKPGELVCAASFSPCDRCTQCARGAAHLCPHKRALNHRGWQGSFAEYVLLSENMTFGLPEGTPAAVGALVEPLAIGLHAVRLAGAAEQRTMVILGSGNIGLCCLMTARRLGFRVLCADVRPSACALALRLGATAFLDTSQTPIANALQNAGSGAPDVVVLAAGYPGALDEALAIVAPGGRVIVVSYFERPHTVGLNALVAGEHAVIGSALCTAADMREVIAWLTDGSLDPLALITHTLPLDAVAEGMRLMCDPQRAAGKIMLSAPMSADA